MQRRFAPFALFPILLFATLLCADDDLIRNGDFGVDDGGAWLDFSMAERFDGVEAERVEDVGRDAPGALRLMADGSRRTAPMWRQRVGEFEMGRRLRAEVWVRGRGVRGQPSLSLRAWGGERLIEGEVSLDDDAALRGDFDWTRLAVELTPPAEAEVVNLLLYLDGAGEVWFDDVSVIAFTPENAGASGESAGIWEARGYSTVTAFEDGASPELLMPLPIAYREQVPLTYRIEVRPPRLARSITIESDDEVNHVARIRLKSMRMGERVELEWSSLVLTGQRDFGAVPDKAPLPEAWPEEATPWLAPSECAQADHPRIASICDEIRGEETDVLTIIDRVCARTRLIFNEQTGRCTSLDAVQALEKQGSCTSAANLVAALLRGCGIPARILAGYPTWCGPLQTHYIVEAWVPGYGWYPIESTLLEHPLQPHQQVQVAIVPVENENRAEGRLAAGGCVPYLSLTEYVNGGASWRNMGAIDPNRNVDHEARSWQRFSPPTDAASRAAWRESLEFARARWDAWLATSPGSVAGGTLRTDLEDMDILSPTIEDLRALLAP